MWVQGAIKSMAPGVRAAVCVSGGVASTKSLRAFVDSFRELCIDATPGGEFHFFFFVRLPSDLTAETLHTELNALTELSSSSSVASRGHEPPSVWLHRVVVEDENNGKDEAAIRVDHPHYDYQAPFKFNQFNTLSMYWKLYTADQYRRRYEFETGVKFDAVVRIRPDLVLHDPIDLHTLNLSRRSVIFLPWFSSTMRLAFDQLAIGPPDAMRAYAKAYYNVPYLTESSALTLGFHPEHTLFMHLHDASVAIARMSPCRTSIARRTGADDIDKVDSFARLKAEFGSAALSCEEEFCANGCEAGPPPPAPPRSANPPPSLPPGAVTAAAHEAAPASPPASPHGVGHVAFGSPGAAPAGGGAVAASSPFEAQTPQAPGVANAAAARERERDAAREAAELRCALALAHGERMWWSGVALGASGLIVATLAAATAFAAARVAASRAGR